MGFLLQAIMAVGVVFLVACNTPSSGEFVLYDFETDEELNRLHWHCHTLYSLSDQYGTHGLRSLKMELFPSDYPGLDTILQDRDWANFSFLGIDIYNPEQEEIVISIRIDDKNNPDYNDRYNKKFFIKPGLNRLSVSLNRLYTSDRTRTLNLETIRKFLLFIPHPQKKVVLYVDYIRLMA
jgi:hypothetical protein